MHFVIDESEHSVQQTSDPSHTKEKMANLDKWNGDDDDDLWKFQLILQRFFRTALDCGVDLLTRAHKLLDCRAL